jgi:protein-disulfide isomerase
MTRRSLAAALAAIALGVAAGPPEGARADETKALRQEIEALKEGQEALRKELEELKGLLRSGRETTAAPRRGQTTAVRVADAPFRGSATAKVTVVEFSDYQCPYCARHHRETLPELDRDYIATGKVRYVVRNFPVAALHKQAVKAAEATGCAGDQRKFWELHDRLFAEPTALAVADLVRHVQAIGLDVPQFQQCLGSGSHAAAVRRDLLEGQKAGVRGTPTFFLGLTEPGQPELKATRLLVGAQPYASFREAIEALLAEAR